MVLVPSINSGRSPSHMPKFFTYILESQKIGKFYVGFTENIDARIRKHNSGGSRWTKRGIPWKIVYTKKFENKRDAIKYEKFLKNLKNKDFIKNIIAGWRSGISPGS